MRTIQIMESGRPKFYMDPKLQEKIDLMISRMTGERKMDNVLLIDGDEGTGKSNMAAFIGNYISEKTGRPITHENFFFDLDKLIEFALNTKEMIIIWDEAALGGLASEWWKKNQIKFIKLLMIARKKKHFFIICIPKFFKLNEYLAVDRSIGLVHTYAKEGIHLGKFTYYNQRKKEYLYENWQKKRARLYRKNYNFHGTFPIALPYVIDENQYEILKDQGIMSLKEKGELNVNALKTEWNIKVIKNIQKSYPQMTQEAIGSILGYTTRNIEELLRKSRLQSP